MSANNNQHHWQPTAKLPALQARALMYQQVRQFFSERKVLEVETPLMCARSITDPYIQPFMVGDRYLQTSPEYAMKRLVAADAGSIYQICKAFRQEEAGNMHNPEFTMVEWYRIGFDHVQLMQETDELLQLILDTNQPAKKVSYQQLFMQNFELNPHTTDIEALKTCAAKHDINLTATASAGLNLTDWLQLLMSHVIEPQLTGPVPWIIYDFPAAQAALAKVIDGEYPVAARFEVYMQGIELANGYYELLNAAEHSKRFAADNVKRKETGVNVHQADERLLAALEAGMPDCAGIALGLDRVLMLKLQAKSISEVLSFSINNA
jgi:lysyl-tRNA synthetase class 2